MPDVGQRRHPARRLGEFFKLECHRGLPAARPEHRRPAGRLRSTGAASAASAVDWDTEYLDAIISVAVVASLEDAIRHVNLHGSHHTDAIISEDQASAARFLDEVDSAIVLHNASTQFADGGEFGMGAEIGISNGKLHARGPVGVEQLTTYKYKVHGAGQVRP